MQFQIIKIARGMTHREYCAVPTIHKVFRVTAPGHAIYWIGFYYQKKFSKV